MGMPVPDFHSLQEDLLLREAIRLSLVDTETGNMSSVSSSGATSSLEELLHHDEEEQMRIAIALSLQESNHTSGTAMDVEEPVSTASAAVEEDGEEDDLVTASLHFSQARSEQDQKEIPP